MLDFRSPALLGMIGLCAYFWLCIGVLVGAI